MNTFIALTLLSPVLTAQPSPLDAGEFEKLHASLRPSTQDGWSRIRWKTSIAQACVQAVREKKPLFMVVRSGHPLGCV